MKLINRFILVCLFIVIAPICSAHSDSVNTENKISVVGVGIVEKEPDVATLNISIHALNATLAAAKKTVDEQYTKLLAEVKKLDIPDKDIKVTRTSAQPEYQWKDGSREHKGEKVSKSIAIKLTETSKVSILMGALVESGISTIDGITASFSNKEALQQQALVKASTNAKQKATSLANSLDRSLGKAVYVNEQNISSPQPYQHQLRMKMAEASLANAPPPEMFGMKKIQATVQVTFDLE